MREALALQMDVFLLCLLLSLFYAYIFVVLPLKKVSVLID